MLRFILISFAFLAFVFYEMSGGADFDAEELRLSRIDAPAEVETTPLQRADLAPLPQPAPENVTRVSLSLTSVNDVLRPTNLRTQLAKETPPIEEEVAVSEEEPVIILPSLIVDRAVITPVTFGEDDEVEQVTPVASGDFAVRAVTGNSVNVRGGPGTNYAVVNRMVRGDKVEILQNPGDGWVQLRPVGGGPVGWMADFLLSDG
ncbi:SH3 domain-containing protein [uncultured Tateyamaria sp.]|uniref:SH3 domain-containing protein n=1 Tax=uncultured Tateyamaria sp. TaxID=455651 RepID=UPI002626115A|nr:SH3 domain-containing protein [uncultured Tateyamaria sp.]